MALSFVSSDPATASADWYINKPIKLNFDKDVDTDTLLDNIIFLIDLAANENVPCLLARSAVDLKQVIVTPKVALKENTNFRLVVVGSDMLLGYYLKADDADALATSVVVLFSTGDNVYKIDTVLEKEAANITLEGDLFLPTNVKALGYDFTVSQVRPKNHACEIAPTVTGDSLIRFKFSKQLLTGQDYSTWADVSVSPILGDSAYLGENDTFNPAAAIPSSTISVSGTDMLITFNAPLPQNAVVTVDLNSNIRSIDNDQYGGGMNYIINTELTAKAFGPEMVKRELNSISASLYDDYINCMLFKNSVFIWENTGRTLNLASMSFAAKKYILLSTLLDIMEDKDYHKFVLGGTRRQLGDLNVSVDNPVGRLALKIARVQKERDIAKETLFKGWQFRSIAGVSLPANSLGDRVWYSPNYRYVNPLYKFFQTFDPVSNTSLNRQAKTNNPFW